MNKSITLTDKKNIVGVTNVVVSDLDGTIFVKTISDIDYGSQGSITFYSKDGYQLGSAGDSVTFDPEKKKLTVTNLVSTQILNEVSYLKRIHLISTTKENVAPYKIKLAPNKDSSKEKLIIIADDYDNKKTHGVLELDGDRISVRQVLNLSLSTPSLIGSINDRIGDIRLDANHLYFCYKEYDGNSIIWKKISWQI